jgi:hypothetical protein
MPFNAPFSFKFNTYIRQRDAVYFVLMKLYFKLNILKMCIHFFRIMAFVKTFI